MISMIDWLMRRRLEKDAETFKIRHHRVERKTVFDGESVREYLEGQDESGRRQWRAILDPEIDVDVAR